MQGSSTQTMYNGEYIASNTKTILVTFNYRLGALGYLAYNDGNGETIEGNFGFRVSVQATPSHKGKH